MMAGEEKILEVAYRLFREKGVQSVNLQHVARACGVSLRQIKLKFQSKKELVPALVGYIIRKKSNFLRINASLSPSAVAELNNYFKFIADNINELGPGMIMELRQNNSITLDQLQEVVEMTLIPAMHRIIERGLCEGFCRDNLDQEIYVPAYFYVLRWVLENQSSDWAETQRLINHINDIFLHGALNIKGMRI